MGKLFPFQNWAFCRTLPIAFQIITNKYKPLHFVFIGTYAVEEHSDSQLNVAGQDAPPTVGLVKGKSDSRLKCVRPIYLRAYLSQKLYTLTA